MSFRFLLFGLLLFRFGLKDGFEIDWYRILSRRDQILLMDVITHKAMEKCEPSSSAAEEALTTLHIFAAGMFNKFCPPVALPRDHASGFQRIRRVSIQSRS